MKLTTMTQVTVDGVMQGNGGASDEDRRSGFERGGWAMGVVDNETMAFINETYQRADAFLFGRRTYELFAGYWGAEERARAAAEDPGNHPITAALNTKPKYLASTTLTEPRWANTTVLSGDLAAAIGELKAKPGGELQVHGSGALIRWLLDNDLVDEMTLLIVPVVLGQGTRLFPDAGPDIALDLVDSRADSKGVTIQVYRPTGRPAVSTRDRRAGTRNDPPRRRRTVNGRSPRCARRDCGSSPCGSPTADPSDRAASICSLFSIRRIRRDWLTASVSGRSLRQACRSQLGTLGRCDLERSARLSADHEHDGVVRQRDRRPDGFHVERAHERACRRVDVLTVHPKPCVSSVDEVQLLVLFVVGIRVVVLAD